jgi:signal transduction histidine kinase
MKLSYKLFFSYVLVALVGLLILAIATAFVAPDNFSHRMRHVGGAGSGMMMGQGMAIVDAELQSTFRGAVNYALILAGIAAMLAAALVSWLVSRRIVHPIRSLVTLSQRIAGGHYEQRLCLDTGDELAELVNSFNRMAASLEETEIMRQRLLGDVTHELKTPLTSIKGYMEGLQDGVVAATPETFQLIHREADRLQRLVEDLQELSRTEAGQLQLMISPHAPHELALTAIERMRPQFQDKRITLSTDMPAELPPVNADPDRTAQILTNLLGNALQYTPSGGEVRVTAARDGGYVRFSVCDSGMGLESVELERIFQRFYRVDKSRSRVSGGSGIGLTVAKYLVEAQGGEIHATSEGIGQGSCFHFTLPLA